MRKWSERDQGDKVNDDYSAVRLAQLSSDK